MCPESLLRNPTSSWENFPLCAFNSYSFYTNFTGMMLDGKTKERFGTVIQPLIKAGIEGHKRVSVLNRDLPQLAGYSHLTGNAFAKRNAYFLVIEAGGGN